MQRNSEQQEELTTRLHLLRHRVALIEEELELTKLIDDTEGELESLAELSPDANLLRSDQLSRKPSPSITIERAIPRP